MLIDIHMKDQVINTHRNDKPKIERIITDTYRRIRRNLRPKKDSIKAEKITPRQAKLQ